PDFTPYFLIQGERCSIEYNQEKNKLYNKKCWSKPGFCRGPILYCLLNDSENSLCYDALTGEGFRDENPRRIPYSFFIGELIHWRIHERYLFDDWADGPWTFSWNCTELGDDILCDCLDDRPRPSLLVLKTMAGRFDGWTNTYGGQTLWGQGITRNLKAEKFISIRHEPGSVQFIYGTGPLNQLFILSDGWLATYKRHETTANGKRITKN
uniref:Uncharacterized protein n=1 Tax=Megaselia scalaris TaxID=36166 RepID=T1GE79_MEGSC